MKKILLIIVVFASIYISNAQIVNIPDANFKAYLVSNNAINTNGDSEIQLSEAAAFSGAISVSNLNISSLTGIEDFTVLTQLYCDNNQLTSLDISKNTALQFLHCNDNNLTSLDVSNNVNLVTLKCQNNQLTNLNIGTVSLATLWCQNNLLTSLDMSNANWNYIDCSNNQLISLSVGTGNMANFEGFDARINNLTCINVNDVGYSTTTWTNIDSLVSFSLNCLACTVGIPDVNFKNYLVGNSLININSDGEIQCSEAYAFTGTIDAGFLSITNLKGIEAFVNLPILYCNNNSLTSVDLGANIALTELYCSSNLLEDLDVTQNVLLTVLNSSSNPLNSIDISQNTALSELWCRYNNLSSLDLSQNTALTYLECRGNQLSSLDLTDNTNLEKLYCRDNQLTSLDVSLNTSLIVLNCLNNQLTSLNVKNGNNTNFTSFFATNNPNLTCVNVDNTTWSTTNWTSIDVQSYFSENCDCIVTIPDATFKSLLVADATLNTNNDAEIQCSEASAYTGTIAVSYWSISDLTGIEAFTSLTSLYCNNNNLTTLDVSQNVVLTFLDCSDNPIVTLDVTQNTNLETLYCATNSLSTLDITQNTSLIFLDCNGNSLTTLNLTQNTDLENLRCYDNQITNLDLSLNTFLFDLDCGNNLLTTLDLSLNTDLGSLVCGNNSLSGLDLSSNTALDFLICTYNNPLTSLNVANGNNINFSYFRVDNNSSLSCIQVDDIAWSTSNWFNIDGGTSFSVNCSVLGIEEAFINDISIYPNPVKDIFMVSIDTPIFKIDIYDNIGRLVVTFSQQEKYDISNLTEGVYFISIQSEDKTYIKKIIIQ
ncbi:MAG: T9SS type A sorting domain-containing protein [Flavobacteriaceae bacterium]